jgi:hypothetical protein
MKRQYNIGDVVYLRTDREQMARLITGIVIRPNTIMYYLSCETMETVHYEIEITTERDIVMFNTN